MEPKCKTDGNDVGGFDSVIFLGHIATHSELPAHFLVSLFKCSSSQKQTDEREVLTVFGDIHRTAVQGTVRCVQMQSVLYRDRFWTNYKSKEASRCGRKDMGVWNQIGLG